MTESKRDNKYDFNLSDLCAERLGDILRTTLDNCEASGWKKGWIAPQLTGCNPRNIDGKDYSFCNSFVLGMATAVKKWKTPYFITMKQLREYGLRVNIIGKRDDGKNVCEEQYPVFMRFTTYMHKKSDGTIDKLTWPKFKELDEEEQNKCYRKRSQMVIWVWNIDQTNFSEQHKERYVKMLEKSKEMKVIQNEHFEEDVEPDDVLEYIITNNHWRCPIVMDGSYSAHSEAFWSPDTIHLPRKKDFVSLSEYYGTALHEMAHSTMMEEQCKRNTGLARYHGDPNYALEEMVAELSAAIVMHDLGFETTISKNHLVYVNSWKKATRRKDAVACVVNAVLHVTKWMLFYYDQKYTELELITKKSKAA